MKKKYENNIFFLTVIDTLLIFKTKNVAFLSNFRHDFFVLLTLESLTPSLAGGILNR